MQFGVYADVLKDSTVCGSWTLGAVGAFEILLRRDKGPVILYSVDLLFLVRHFNRHGRVPMRILYEIYDVLVLQLG